MTSTTLSFIFDGVGPQDGEFYADLEKLWANLPYASRDALVMAFDASEVRQHGTTPMRDVTEDMVREAFTEGYLTADAVLVKAHLTLPETADEHLGSLADAAWHQREIA